MAVQTINDKARMTVNEASERYPDNFILMQMDSRNISNPAGMVLYVGDDDNELFALQIKNNVPRGLVVEGINKQQSLGGIVIGV